MFIVIIRAVRSCVGYPYGNCPISCRTCPVVYRYLDSWVARGATKKGCVPSESLDVNMSVADEFEPRALDTDVDVYRRLDTDTAVSPPRNKRVRFGD